MSVSKETTLNAGLFSYTGEMEGARSTNDPVESSFDGSVIWRRKSSR